MPQDFEYIPGRYGYSLQRTGPLAVAGRIHMMPSLVEPDGSMRAVAVLMAIDMTCGMAGGLAVLPKWTVTADAEVHFVAPCTVGPLRVDAISVRAGRAMSVVDAEVVDEGADDMLVALATANHGVLESDFDHFLASAEIGDTQHFARPDHRVHEPLEEFFGLSVASDGAVSIPLEARSTNPWGILHGGLTGLLVDGATRQAGISAPSDIVMRFLNPVRSGPAVATVASIVERPRDRVARIEVRDGPDGRLAVVGHVVGAS